MAKEKMITRTIESTTLNVMVCEITNASVSTVEVSVSGNVSGREALELAQGVIDSTATERVVVKVLSAQVESALYGMPESMFLKYAERLPDRKVTNN